MPLPRKGILIRVVLYGALLSYFGYQAWSRHAAEKAAEKAAEDELPTARKMQLPDGRTIEVIEVTPEQAAAMSGSPAAFERGDAPAPTTPTPTPEAAPTPAPTTPDAAPPTPDAAPPAAEAAPTPAPAATAP